MLYMLYSILHYSTTHSVLDANFGGAFEHPVFSIWARPGRGLGLAASSSTSNRVVNSTWFKYQKN